MNSLKLRRLAERITKINRLNNKLYSNLGISVPKYILDEIIDGGDKDNIIALIGLAKINDSILEGDARIFINNIDKYLLLK